MRYVLIILAILISDLQLHSQINITWGELSQVEIKQQLFPEDGLTYDVPTFSEALKKLSIFQWLCF